MGFTQYEMGGELHVQSVHSVVFQSPDRRPVVERDQRSGALGQVEEFSRGLIAPVGRRLDAELQTGRGQQASLGERRGVAGDARLTGQPVDGGHR